MSEIREETRDYCFTLSPGDGYSPSFLRIEFKTSWNLAIKRSRFSPLFKPEEVSKIEIRDGVRSLLYTLEREILKAIPESFYK